MDKSNFIEELVSLLEEAGIRYCVIGGQAVNAYVEPLVSLDLDIAVALDQLAEVESKLRSRFHVAEFRHSLNVTAPGSDLRVQIQTDRRYGVFVARASVRNVLGVGLPVACVEDVLQGKVWAATDPERRASKRRKDLLDIERLIESMPELRPLVPAELVDRLDDGR